MKNTQSHLIAQGCRLLFNRDWLLRNKEKFEPERRYMLYCGIETLLYPFALIEFDGDSEKKKASIHENFPCLNP